MLVMLLAFRLHRIGGAHRTVGVHRRALRKPKRHGDGVSNRDLARGLLQHDVVAAGL